MPLLALLCFLAFDDTSDTLVRELKKMLDVFVTIDREAADPVDPDQVFFQGAMPGMLRTLDPHSIFSTPTRSSSLNRWRRADRKDSAPSSTGCPAPASCLQTFPERPPPRPALPARRV